MVTPPEYVVHLSPAYIPTTIYKQTHTMAKIVKKKSNPTTRAERSTQFRKHKKTNQIN